MVLLLLACTESAPLDRPAPPPAPYPIAAPEPPAPEPPAPEPPEPPAPTPPDNLQEWPIPYGRVRKALTQAYRAAHVGDTTGDVEVDTTMTPQVIVLHWTGGCCTRSAWFTFEPERRPRRPDLTGAKALNVSAHFLVARDGTIYRLMDETRMGRHTIGLNHLAVGIENVGDGARYPLTQAQVDADIALVTWLVARFPSITHLIGHHEYRAFEHAGHPYFQEHDSLRRTRKVDPGEDFMAAVRAGLEAAGLEGPPVGAESGPDPNAAGSVHQQQR